MGGKLSVYIYAGPNVTTKNTKVVYLTTKLLLQITSKKLSTCTCCVPFAYLYEESIEIAIISTALSPFHFTWMAASSLKVKKCFH